MELRLLSRSSARRRDRAHAAEIERMHRLGGVVVLHVAVHRRVDKYSANDLLYIDGLLSLFCRSEVVRVSKVAA
jgi:hypothetical protein